MKVRIEGGGHLVEIDGSAMDHSLTQVLDLAEGVWRRTRTPESPRQQVGFGSQLVERRGDQPIPNSYTAPVTA